MDSVRVKAKSMLALLLLVYFANLTQVSVALSATTTLPSSSLSFQDGDCFGHEALTTFKISPGGYGLGEPIDSKQCTSLCEDIAMPLAAIANKGYCLCAASIDPQNGLKKVDSTRCEKNGDGIYLRAYNCNLDTLEEGLTIKGLVENAYLDELVNFETNFDNSKLNDVQVQLDFGDGAISNWTDEKRHPHIFRLPGKYEIKVHAKHSGGRRIRAASTRLAVVEKFQETEVKFDCYDIIEPGDKPGCNGTISAGQDMNITVNFGDESESLLFNSMGKLQLLLFAVCVAIPSRNLYAKQALFSA